MTYKEWREGKVICWQYTPFTKEERERVNYFMGKCGAAFRDYINNKTGRGVMNKITVESVREKIREVFNKVIVSPLPMKDILFDILMVLDNQKEDIKRLHGKIDKHITDFHSNLINLPIQNKSKEYSSRCCLCDSYKASVNIFPCCECKEIRESVSYFSPKIKEVPELRPIDGEVWRQKGQENCYIFIEKSNGRMKRQWFGRVSEEVCCYMIHGKNGWSLIHSPNPERMKIIEKEKHDEEKYFSIVNITGGKVK